MATDARPTPPAHDPTYPAQLELYNVNMAEWYRRTGETCAGLATSSFIFDAAGRLLSIQRAKHDSMPCLWEVPGGAVDPEDPSLMRAAAREIFEETGLVAKNIVRLVLPPANINAEGGSYFTNRNGTRTYCRFSFEVEVADGAEVKLDPDEHQDFLWVTEEQVRKQRFGEREIPVTNEHMAGLILEAFAQRRAEGRLAA